MNIMNLKPVLSLCNSDYILLNIGYYNSPKKGIFNHLKGFVDTDNINDIYDYTYLFLEKDKELYKFFILENLTNKTFVCDLVKVKEIYKEELLFLRSYDKENNRIVFNQGLFYSMLASLRTLIYDAKQTLIIDYDSILKTENKLKSFF